MKQIHNFEDFLAALRETGMSMGGENDEGVFALSSYFTGEVKWHTQDPGTDPWEWRMRVLNECGDIAYGKLFFKKSGYVTKTWWPYFYAVRRGAKTLEEEYEEGTVSRTAKQIYDVVKENGKLPLHLIKEYGGLAGKEHKSRFDAGLAELQMKMYLTMCGRAAKISGRGSAYGWNATVFCPADAFFGEEAAEAGRTMDPEEAYRALMAQVKKLNPQVSLKKAHTFLCGAQPSRRA